MDRYVRNKQLISEKEQEMLSGKTVAVIGLGGLGGHIAEQLARLGVGNLILIDSDVVEPNNLNRQMFATEKTLVAPKTQAAAERLEVVNPHVKYSTHSEYLTLENGAKLLRGADIVMDAVDNVPTRYVLEKCCAELNLPFIHGSIGGWWGQVSVIFPGDNIIERIYPKKDAVGAEAKWGNPAFTPAVVASIQTAEALKIFLGKSGILRGKLLRIDLLEHEYFTIDLMP
jgi:molybdopterin/thiamine biosynthesis adenylyltransferase